MATSEQDKAPDRADSFNPTHGPPRPKFTPLLLTIGVLMLVLLVFAVVGWLRYNTG